MLKTASRNGDDGSEGNPPTLQHYLNKLCSSCYHYWDKYVEWRLSYSAMWRCKVRRVRIVAEEPATSRFRVSRQRQMDPPKHVSLSTRLHGVTCHKAATPPPPPIIAEKNYKPHESVSRIQTVSHRIFATFPLSEYQHGLSVKTRVYPIT